MFEVKRENSVEYAADFIRYALICSGQNPEDAVDSVERQQIQEAAMVVKAFKNYVALQARWDEQEER